jgi:5-(carboxyamino)imidazole ribonucleotide synthase
MLKIGLLGGGQLAQMLTQAAISLGLETAIYERLPDTPAACLTHHHAIGEWSDTAALLAFARGCEVLTLENEFVDADALAEVEAAGISVFPKPSTLATIQDKLRQKERYATADLAVPPFCAIESPEDVRAAAMDFGYPLVLKARYGGYDGYGNATIHSEAEITPAWDRFSGRETRGLMVEAFVPFVKELAVMVLRGRDGETRAYPVVETVQQNHICHVVRAPAAISERARHAAADLATRAVGLLHGVGVFGVELFLLADDSVLLNEIAPRPHNSGHYTIEACVTSQFENHLRAVLGLPLGSTDMIAPAAVMVNLLGKRAGAVSMGGVRNALRVEGAHLHLYGKRESRVGRKMGHVTVLGDNLATAELVARRAANAVEV